MKMRAGLGREIAFSSGKWVLLDIGFSNAAKTCGLLVQDGALTNVSFGEATKQISEILNDYVVVNLVVEAPLSIAFNRFGNPAGRTPERRDGKTRYWYCGPGAAATLAAMHLILSLDANDGQAELRLFEGFVSFKSKKNRSSHKRDVELLREVVERPALFQDCISTADQLRMDTSDVIRSVTSVAGLDFGIPPVLLPSRL